MDEISSKSNVRSTQDWRKVTSHIIIQGGGKVSSDCFPLKMQGLLHNFGGSVSVLLHAVYPFSDWMNLQGHRHRMASSEKVRRI